MSDPLNDSSYNGGLFLCSGNINLGTNVLQTWKSLLRDNRMWSVVAAMLRILRTVVAPPRVEYTTRCYLFTVFERVQKTNTYRLFYTQQL